VNAVNYIVARLPNQWFRFNLSIQSRNFGIDAYSAIIQQISS